MNDNNQKSMQGVKTSYSDVMQKPPFVPSSTSSEPIRKDIVSRIDKNSFFNKKQDETTIPLKKRGQRKGSLIIVLIMVMVIGLGFLFANYFSSATITVAPLVENTYLEHDFIATREGKDGTLVFESMSFTEEKSKGVSATVEKDVQKKASGKVVIYNEYSSQSQRLIVNTRLEASNKKVFRIDESVVVPGAQIKGGKVISPGTVEVMAYADVPGKEYNIGFSDFTIPGFKGDPRYVKFSARSKSDSPMEGGFSGVIKVATDKDIAQAQTIIRDELKQNAVEKALAQIPADASFFPGSMVIKFEDVPYKPSGDAPFGVTVRAVVSVIFFNTETLAKKIADVALPDHKAPFELVNLAKLSFTFLDTIDKVVLSDLARIRFRVAGDLSFVGLIDAPTLVSHLAGKDKKDFADIIATQNSIKTADAVIRPMWKTAFPLDAQKISVTIIKETPLMKK